MKEKTAHCFNNYCVQIYLTEIKDLFISLGKNIFPLIQSFEIDEGIELKLEITSEARFMLSIIEQIFVIPHFVERS